jgi:hypothetical protein
VAGWALPCSGGHAGRPRCLLLLYLLLLLSMLLLLQVSTVANQSLCDMLFHMDGPPGGLRAFLSVAGFWPLAGALICSLNHTLPLRHHLAAGLAQFFFYSKWLLPRQVGAGSRRCSVLCSRPQLVSRGIRAVDTQKPPPVASAHLPAQQRAALPLARHPPVVRALPRTERCRRPLQVIALEANGLLDWVQPTCRLMHRVLAAPPILPEQLHPAQQICGSPESAAPPVLSQVYLMAFALSTTIVYHQERAAKASWLTATTGVQVARLPTMLWLLDTWGLCCLAWGVLALWQRLGRVLPSCLGAG